jgi:hypothetical protein
MIEISEVKMAGALSRAAAYPLNAAKPSESGELAGDSLGQAVEPDRNASAS